MAKSGQFLLIVFGLLIYINAEAETGNEVSPHVKALMLVFSSPLRSIRQAEKEHWQNDTKQRTWSVKRPFHPGRVDSTYMFEVEYRVDGRRVALWHVNTRDKSVVMEEQLNHK